MKHFAFALALFFGIQAQAQSYISRLWNTKKYDQIIEYSPKGATLSGQDNMIVGQAFMKLEEPNAQKALEHYDLAIAKKLTSEDLYFYRSQAHYALGQFDAALSDLEVCLSMRPNYQKYLLSKASIAYEKGDKDLAYTTYDLITELYDKQLPFYMLAVINLERERYYKAREQVDNNMLRFEKGKEFWMFTAEQQVDLEWKVFKNYEKALAAQRELLEFKPDQAGYLINQLLLLRLMGRDAEAQLAENDLLERYNTNRLPLEYYKKGSILVGVYERPNGILEDYLTFRPQLYDNTKYARFFLSNEGLVLGRQWAGLVQDPEDSSKVYWDFHATDRYRVFASDTSYASFTSLFSMSDSALHNTRVLGDSLFMPERTEELRDRLPVQRVSDSAAFEPAFAPVNASADRDTSDLSPDREEF